MKAVISDEIEVQPILIVPIEESEAIQAKLDENGIIFNIDEEPLSVNHRVTDHVIFFRPSDRERIRKLLGV